jgi:hypothetical protein
MVEAPGAFADFPMDQDDMVYPCKGCGEVRRDPRCVLLVDAVRKANSKQILEEGKAFELGKSDPVHTITTTPLHGPFPSLSCPAHLLPSLPISSCPLPIWPLHLPVQTLTLSAAGNRWHIDCFRCNTCGTLLDSDANLLLLGDGSLICNNCTYSCSACGNKIEDLAILTGDQAFCANCFKCRNCKRKIDNLRYARTSQGIFCMSCHETLMARRRKNKKANRNPTPASNGLNKSLPDLPRGDIPLSAFSSTPDMETPPSEKYSEVAEKFGDTASDISPRPRASKSRNDGSIDRTTPVQRELSDNSLDEVRKGMLSMFRDRGERQLTHLRQFDPPRIHIPRQSRINPVQELWNIVRRCQRGRLLRHCTIAP